MFYLAFSYLDFHLVTCDFQLVANKNRSQRNFRNLQLWIIKKLALIQ